MPNRFRILVTCTMGTMLMKNCKPWYALKKKQMDINMRQRAREQRETTQRLFNEMDTEELTPMAKLIKAKLNK